jgi:membrane protease YdiL (CAAX protease family)
MTSSDARKTLALLLLASYFAVRFIYDAEVSQVSTYAPYLFEMVFVGVVAAAFSRDLNLRLELSRETALQAIGALASGAVIFAGASLLKLPIPFDLHSGEVVLFLLLIGPVLEEFVIRLAHWDLAVVLLGNRERGRRDIPWAYTSALFSFAHFTAYFYVPSELRPFVIYQSAYTLLLGTYCGWCRLRSRGLWLPIIVHLCFNLGFFAAAKMSGVEGPAPGVNPPSSSVAAPQDASTESPAPHIAPDSCPRVLIVDVPVSEDEVRELHPALGERFKLVKNLESPRKLQGRTCAVALDHSEQLIDLQKGKIAAPGWLDQSAIEEVRAAIETTHGYHVLGLIAKDTSCAKFFTIGLPPSNPQRLADAARYKQDVAEEWKAVKEAIRQIQPHIVSVSAWQSYSENKSDLKENGYSEQDADREALDLTAQWKEIWLELLKSNPETKFFVAAGNGGLDWKGDSLADEKSVADASFPGFLQAPNLFAVASLDPHSRCLSGFSNYGSPKVRVAAIGEDLDAPVPCATHPSLRLSGTPQATAEFTNAFIRALERGETADAFFQSLSRPPCLEGKVELGL